MLVAVGLCSTLNRYSSTAAWACFEILGATGLGSLSISLLPALQAPLEERHAATSVGIYSFARGFGAIWGFTIPSALFNNVVKHRVTTNDSAFATNPSLTARPPTVRPTSSRLEPSSIPCSLRITWSENKLFPSSNTLFTSSSMSWWLLPALACFWCCWKTRSRCGRRTILNLA